MEKTINELIDLAKEWKSFSYDVNGWEIVEYRNEQIKVWCYFSDAREHTSVKFSTNEFNSKHFEVAFFSPVRVSFSPSQDIGVFLEARQLLAGRKEEYEKKSIEEREADKAKKIEHLQLKIKDLEAADAQ